MTGLATFALSVTEPYRDFLMQVETTLPISVRIVLYPMTLILQQKGLKITDYKEDIPKPRKR